MIANPASAVGGGIPLQPNSRPNRPAATDASLTLTVVFSSGGCTVPLRRKVGLRE